ncbi:MAG: hypothetical protein Q8L46_01575 [candidate division WWE3 bacterium]|nr:hypothetical protein [candidate division WWE3 bacterium]
MEPAPIENTQKIQESAREIQGIGREAVDNTFVWMKKHGLITAPEQAMATSDPDRYRSEMDNYLKRTSTQILESGYTIACADNVQVMVDLLTAKGEKAECVDALSDTFLKTGDKQGHMFIEVFVNGEMRPYSPVTGEWCEWQVDNMGRRFIRWKGEVLGQKFDEKYYFFKRGKSPQEMGYEDVGSMQGIVEDGREKLITELELKIDSNSGKLI